MDYNDFLTYPIRILGIDATYNSEIAEIEEFVNNEINYSGDNTDLVLILPYFVFYKFCEKKRSEVTAQTGEQEHTAEFTVPSLQQQINAWNIAAKKLDALCIANKTEANKSYRSQISPL